MFLWPSPLCPQCPSTGFGFIALDAAMPEELVNNISPLLLSNSVSWRLADLPSPSRRRRHQPSPAAWSQGAPGRARAPQPLTAPVRADLLQREQLQLQWGHLQWQWQWWEPSKGECRDRAEAPPAPAHCRVVPQEGSRCCTSPLLPNSARYVLQILIGKTPLTPVKA